MKSMSMGGTYALWMRWLLFCCKGDGLTFLFGKGKQFGIAMLDRFGVDARTFPGVKGRDDSAGISAVQKGYGEALIASDLFERIESHDADLMDAFLREAVDTIGNLEQFLDLLVHKGHVIGLLEDDIFEAFGSIALEKRVLSFGDEFGLMEESYDQKAQDAFAEDKAQYGG
ncbi:MAG: hypothetical protein PHT88_03250 [Candidatus Moranbacteria bacterium]|nr:hypothetical protein [Candidatus Moranbacteria bacterium]